MMIEFLSEFNFWHWFGLAALLLVIELVIANTGFLLWIAISAAFVGLLLCFFSLTWPWQLVIFIAVSLLYAKVGKKYLRRHPIVSDQPKLNKRAEQYVGRELVLELPIENNMGRVQLDDGSWSIKGPNLPAGTKIKIIGVDGVILRVKEV